MSVSPSSWRLGFALLALALRLDLQWRGSFRHRHCRLRIFVVFVDELLHDHVLAYEVRDRGIGAQHITERVEAQSLHSTSSACLAQRTE